MEFKANKEQSDWLHALYLHQQGVSFDGRESDFGYYAHKLDSLNVPFWVQNLVAYLATKKDFAELYFRNICKTQGITITS